jgi:hypothetical protein
MAVILEVAASATSPPAVKLSIALNRSDCMLYFFGDANVVNYGEKSMNKLSVCGK